jgi:hypothetical protein
MMHGRDGRLETMQSVDERGRGPDRRAVQKRMRDVDVASVDFGVEKGGRSRLLAV